MQTIGISVYRKKDYARILELSEDSENMDATWEDWEANKKQTKAKFESLGVRVVDVPVKPNELAKFCQEKGLKINGTARAQFVSEKVNSQ